MTLLGLAIILIAGLGYYNSTRIDDLHSRLYQIKDLINEFTKESEARHKEAMKLADILKEEANNGKS